MPAHTYNRFSRVVISGYLSDLNISKIGYRSLLKGIIDLYLNAYARVSVRKLADNLSRNKMDTAVYFPCHPTLNQPIERFAHCNRR
jgi:hypothetical protein